MPKRRNEGEGMMKNSSTVFWHLKVLAATAEVKMSESRRGLCSSQWFSINGIELAPLLFFWRLWFLSVILDLQILYKMSVWPQFSHHPVLLFCNFYHFVKSVLKFQINKYWLIRNAWLWWLWPFLTLFVHLYPIYHINFSILPYLLSSPI